MRQGVTNPSDATGLRSRDIGRQSHNRNNTERREMALSLFEKRSVQRPLGTRSMGMFTDADQMAVRFTLVVARSVSE